MGYGDILASLPLFDTLSLGDTEALGARMTARQYTKGDHVFKMGESGSSMYIVLSGSVEIYLPGEKTEEESHVHNNVEQESHVGTDDLLPEPKKPSKIILKELRKGEYFGELSLFDAKPRSASAMASQHTELLELTRDVFEEHLRSSPGAAMAMLAELAERLRETNLLLSQRATSNAVKQIDDNLNWSQKLADKIANLNGSWTFILFLLGFSLFWFGINHFLARAFDGYPYVFFNLLLAILASLQGPLIMMSQNRQTLKDRAQAEADFRVNLKNEVNIEQIRHELFLHQKEIQGRFNKIEETLSSK